MTEGPDRLLPAASESWCVARSVKAAQPRQRVALLGTVVDVRERNVPGPIFEADLDDGTGQATLVFVGRRSVPGVVPGAVLTAEATLLTQHGRLELLNPSYHFEPPLEES